MKKIFTFMVAALMSVTSFAQFSGSGSGTENDPYLIFNPIQLDQVRNFLGQEGVYFKLMANIDLSDFITENYSSQGWSPIGTSSSPFQGNFNGNGKTISHLTINRPTADYIGLFGNIGRTAVISNFSIIECSIKGQNRTGGLCGNIGNDGSANGATLSNISIEGTISGTSNVGGAIGSISGVIATGITHSINSLRFKGCVKGTNNNTGGLIGIIDQFRNQGNCSINNGIVEATIQGTHYVGGVIGRCRNGQINACSAIVDINASGDYCGGVIGGADGYYESSPKSGQGNVEISTCHVSGNIEAKNSIGGVVGYLKGYMIGISGVQSNLNNSYFHGKIVGSDYVGGICGRCYMCDITKNYSKATISGTTCIGGILGYEDVVSSPMPYTNLKQNVAIHHSIGGNAIVGRIYGSLTAQSRVGEVGSTETNKALTTMKVFVNGIAQTVTDDKQNGQGVGNSVLKYKAAYQGIDWDFANIWEQQETESYPYFKTQVAPPVINSAHSGETFVSGNGTNGATIRVSINGSNYTTTCSGNTWTVNTSSLVAGSTIYAIASASGKVDSYQVSSTVSYVGDGTSANPYQITTAQELANISGSGYYKLMNDIDVSSINPWIPIGQNEVVTAHLDGDNHTISGINTNSTNSYRGLFAECNGSILKNIKITITKLQGGDYVGGLVAKITNGQITNCHVTNNVTGYSYVGGIAGLASNTAITECSVKGNITGRNLAGGVAGSISGTLTKSKHEGIVISRYESAVIGGLAGENSATISECYTSGIDTCALASSYVGGIAGKNLSGGKITDCYSLSRVHAEQNAGGIVGRNYGRVEKCYAKGNVASANVAAGVVGYNDGTNAVVQNCCAMNAIVKATASNGTAVRVIGGLANSAPTPSMNNYALKTMAVSVNGVPQTIYDDNLHGVAKTETQLKQSATYSALSWDLTNTWVLEETATYPQLRYFTKLGTIRFVNYNGTELQKSSVIYGIVPTYSVAIPSRAATAEWTYTFTGWKPNIVAVNGDAIYTATYDSTRISYTITWKNDDGSTIDQTTVEYGQLPTHADPSKNATAQYTYTFAGWSPNVVAVTGDTTYTATYNASVRSYTITFKNGNNVLQSTDIEYGVVPTYIGTVPTKQATAQYTYTFKGWSPNIVAVITEATYTATFDSIVNKYTVTFKNGEQELQSTEVEYGQMPAYNGETPVKPADAQYTYTFAGWSPDITKVTGNVIYTAMFNSIAKKYTITWKNDDGSIIDQTMVKYGQLPTHSDPAKQATAEFTYAFAGWSPEVGTVTGDTTYTATYTATRNKYTITWKNDDGGTIDQTTVEYGQIPAHAAPSKLATAQYTYTFAGWSPEVAAITGDATYTATFDSIVNKYTIKFINGEQELQSTEVEYGQMPTYNGAIPTKPADAQYTYTFAGWSPKVEAVTGEAMYTATFNTTANSYTITWKNDDGSTIDQTSVEYGQVPTHAVPTKVATAEFTYTFAGWTPQVVAVTEDATYTATYTATRNSYTITWKNDDGSTIDQTTVEYGQIPTHTDPTKAATAQYTYTFAGWSPSIVAVTGDATYTAIFNATVRTYNITFLDDDGSLINKISVEYGKLPTQEDPSKPSTARYTYVFAGWTPEIVPVTGNATYTATYTSILRKYTITFLNEDGTILSEEKWNYGEVPTCTAPTKEATTQYTYTFTGWTPEVVAVTGDATYTAVFEAVVRKYMITFLDEDGIELCAQEWEYGAMPSCAEPTKADDDQYTYTFAGWTPEIVAVVGEATYTATYTATAKPEGIYDVEADIPVQKIIRDGQFFILRGDKVYTTTGQEVK